MLNFSRATSIKFVVACFVSVLIGLGLGLFIPIYYNYDHGSIEVIHEVRNQENYKFINPLLECESANISQDGILSNLRKEIKTYIDSQINNHKITFASVYYRDLNNGPWTGINYTTEFSPASLIKVPLMMAYYQAAQSDPTILQKKIINNQPFNIQSQNIQPEIHLELNQEYTIEELINRMIIYSDNLAYDLLLKNIDDQKIYEVYNDLGVDISKAAQDPNGNIVSVLNYASFFRILFNSSYLNKDMSEKALQLLSQVKYDQGLIAGLPPGITVAHKFGERQYTATGEKQLHDCGIIYLPQKPYLLCVMTRGNNFEKEAQTIKQISTMVYDWTSKNLTN